MSLTPHEVDSTVLDESGLLQVAAVTARLVASRYMAKTGSVRADEAFSRAGQRPADLRFDEQVRAEIGSAHIAEHAETRTSSTVVRGHSLRGHIMPSCYLAPLTCLGLRHV